MQLYLTARTGSIRWITSDADSFGNMQISLADAWTLLDERPYDVWVSTAPGVREALLAAR